MGCWCFSSPVLSLSLFHHPELEPVAADGGFRLWFGCRVMWRGEMDSIPWAFPLVYSHWFTGSTEKREAKWGEERCVLCADCYTVFPTDYVSGRGFGEEPLCVGWGMTPVCSGRKCSSWNQEVSWSHPSGFTVCRQAVALAATASSLLHHHVSKETIHRKKNLLTVLFVYFCQKKRNQISNGCFYVSGIPEERLKEFFFTYSRCSLTAPCGAAQFIHLLLLHR